MQSNRVGLIVAGALIAAVASSAALAGGGYGHRKHGWHGGHHSYGYSGIRFGLSIGGPLWWGAPVYYPRTYYYYSPPVVAVPASPPVYIERGDAQPAPEPGSANWWYYCQNPAGYYPYVRQCPGGWQRVPSQPPPG